MIGDRMHNAFKNKKFIVSNLKISRRCLMAYSPSFGGMKSMNTHNIQT